MAQNRRFKNKTDILSIKLSRGLSAIAELLVVNRYRVGCVFRNMAVHVRGLKRWWTGTAGGLSVDVIAEEAVSSHMPV